MASIVLLFLCLALGLIAQRIRVFPSNAHLTLNQFILNFALPAMALYYVPKMQLSWDLLLPFAMPWLHFLLAYLFFNFLGKKYAWSKKMIGCLILTAGLGNTSFVGIPVIQALFGDEGLKTLIVIDLPGTFMILSTWGIIVANKYAAGSGVTSSQIAKKVLTFPTIWAFIVGLVMCVLGLEFPVVIDDVLRALYLVITPLALVSVGLQLRIDPKSKHYKFLALGLAFQLLLIPALFLCLYVLLMGKTETMVQVTIMEAGMAPMVTSAIIASAYGLKPRLANMMIGVGIPLSFLSLGIWYWVLMMLV